MVSWNGKKEREKLWRLLKLMLKKNPIEITIGEIFCSHNNESIGLWSLWIFLIFSFWQEGQKLPGRIFSRVSTHDVKEIEVKCLTSNRSCQQLNWLGHANTFFDFPKFVTCKSFQVVRMPTWHADDPSQNLMNKNNSTRRNFSYKISQFFTFLGGNRQMVRSNLMSTETWALCSLKLHVIEIQLVQFAFVNFIHLKCKFYKRMIFFRRR